MLISHQIEQEERLISRDVILKKIDIIERRRRRIEEVYDDNPHNLEDYTKQDSIVLNIQRACEATIDLAMHVVSRKKLGIPQNSRDAFEVLLANGFIDESLCKKLKGMVGFRNIAVHNYQEIQVVVVQQVIERHIKDLELFTAEMMRYA